LDRKIIAALITLPTIRPAIIARILLPIFIISPL
jgi:hypothetical protein